MDYADFEMRLDHVEMTNCKDFIYEMPVGVAIVRGGNKFQLEVVNKEFLRPEGYLREELLDAQHSYIDYIYQDDVDKFEDAIDRCRTQKTTEVLELRLRTKDGDVHWEMIQCKLYGYRDAVPYYILTSWDINQRKGLEEDLKLLDEKYRMLEEVTDEFTFEYDVTLDRFRVPQHYYINGKVSDLKKQYMSRDEVMADIYKGDRPKYEEALREAMQSEQTGSIDYRLNVASKQKKPQYVWYRTVYRSIMGEEGKIERIIGRNYDVSSDHRIQEELSAEMRLDPLTRILNKVAALEEVDRIIQQNPENTHVLFLIDVDDFKQINDNFGHTVGDTVILDVAQVIREQFSEDDIVARVGGDEFLAFMKNTTVEQAGERAKNLCQAATKRLIGDEAIINVTLSIGLAVCREDGEDYETLFHMADRAMYQTKSNGKNGYSFVEKNQLPVGATREKRVDGDTSRGQDADREFLHFAFSLLSHARDINGSLNVLLEQIGKKYGLDSVSVFEHLEDCSKMRLMNYWSRYGHTYTRDVFVSTMEEFEQAKMGELVATDVTDFVTNYPGFVKNNANGQTPIRYLAGIKFEFGGNRVGGLYLGVSQSETGFTSEEESTFQELARVVSVFVSLRSKLNDDQKAINQLKEMDKLTGLYNLPAFRERIEKQLVTGTIVSDTEVENGEVYALVHIDVNNFSYVNENFGQQIGDSILQEYGRQISREEHVVEACRMYSDYFVELVKGSSKKDIYQKVKAENRQFESEQKKKYPASTMRLSAGICFIEKGEDNSFETILESANLARKQAKEQKSHAVIIYEKTMRAKRDEENQITGRFYAAMQRGELEVYLQPKFLLKEQRIYGAEALARWRAKSGEILSPAKFIPALENMGYIVDLDFYILEQLLRAMRRWQDAGKQLFTVSTNFSRRHFENGGSDFINRLNQTMERYKIEPQYIEIEVTESAVVENLDTLKQCLAELEQMGYRIAIDDFGTGYSSLSMLLEIPADVIKIDKSFTDRINLAEQQEFVSRMGQFIRSAKEEVIFEGIEEDMQRKFLMECGFYYGQGYLFDRPLPLDEFERKYI